jgi:hypothetical protein
MYRISSGIDLKDIVGSEIHQICLGQFDVQFRFGSKTVICVQSRITLLDRGAIVASWDEKANWTTLEFQKLLNVPIIDYSVPNDRLLEIQFFGGLTLQLHDDSDQHESMQIYPRGEVVGQIII